MSVGHASKGRRHVSGIVVMQHQRFIRSMEPCEVGKIDSMCQEMRREEPSRRRRRPCETSKIDSMTEELAMQHIQMLDIAVRNKKDSMSGNVPGGAKEEEEAVRNWQNR